MPPTNLSTFDRIINIHQSFKLQQVVALNKEMLNAQLRQNQKLNILNNQLAEANNINKQLLLNQIAELKREEEQRFYKSLAFNCLEIIEMLEKIDDNILQVYFVQTYYEKLNSKLEQAKDTLEELSDKIQIKKYIERLSLIVDNSKASAFSNSFISQLSSLILDYQTTAAVFDKELNEFQGKIKAFKIPSPGLFGFNKKAMLKALSESFELETKFTNKQEEKKITLTNHKLNPLFAVVKTSFPHFDNIIDEITSIEDSFKIKFQPTLKPKADPLLKKAAQIIVLHQQGSTSLIQRKLKLGYNRAGRIIEQLEQAGVVGAFEGNNSREVKIKNADDLENLLR